MIYYHLVLHSNLYSSCSLYFFLQQNIIQARYLGVTGDKKIVYDESPEHVYYEILMLRRSIVLPNYLTDLCLFHIWILLYGWPGYQFIFLRVSYRSSAVSWFVSFYFYNPNFFYSTCLAIPFVFLSIYFFYVMPICLIVFLLWLF